MHPVIHFALQLQGRLNMASVAMATSLMGSMIRMMFFTTGDFD